MRKRDDIVKAVRGCDNVQADAHRKLAEWIHGGRENESPLCD
jgi:hypothetical protein